VERPYRGGISDVDPLPARLNLRAQCSALRSLWLNPALCGSPVYRREAKSVLRDPISSLEFSFGRTGRLLKSGSFAPALKKLAAGGSGQGKAGAEGPARQCRVGLGFASFGYGKKRDGANIGNGASL